MVRIKLCRRLIPTTCAVLYEIAGTIGPITAVKLIDSVGENFSFFLAPVSLALSGIVWFFIRPTQGQDEPALPEDPVVEIAIPQPGFLRRLYKGTLSHPKEALISIQTLTTYRLLGSFDLEWRCYCIQRSPLHLAYPLLLICTPCTPVRQSREESRSVNVIP